MALGPEESTEFNINHGSEENQPTDPVEGSVYLVTAPKQKRRTEVCYENGEWESISPLSVDENGVLLYNGKVLTPHTEELPISGGLSPVSIEMPGTIGKTGQLKTLYILRSGSTGTAVYIRLVDKYSVPIVPEITLNISSGSTGTYNFSDRIGDFVKKESTDRIMIRAAGNNTSIAAGTLFATGYIQAAIE